MRGAAPLQTPHKHPSPPKHTLPQHKHTLNSERPYGQCSGVCKSIIDPGSEQNFQVHEFVRDRTYTVPTQPVPRECAFILHFHRLFGPRGPKFVAGLPRPVNAANLTAAAVKTC